MSKQTHDTKQNDLWLDRWLSRLWTPVLNFLARNGDQKTKSPRVIKVAYGSSEPCYCGSEKKYKHCCKKKNKQEGKVAIKVIRQRKSKRSEKVKLIRELNLPKKGIFQNYPDSGIDPTSLV